jgi:hypothetical protein
MADQDSMLHENDKSPTPADTRADGKDTRTILLLALTILLLQGIWTVAFQSSVDALRFTHAAQMLLMHTQWPSWAQPYCGQSVPGPDGRWLFHGPRVVMTVHESPDFFVSSFCLADPARCCLIDDPTSTARLAARLAI